MSGLDDILGGGTGGRGQAGGLNDILSGALGGQRGGMLAMLAPLLAGLLGGGGLEKLLSGFRQKGMGAKADSWIGTGPNEPVSADEVREVLGSEQLADIAQQLGISEEQAADALADVLPSVVDDVSPEGQLPPQDDLDRILDSIRQPSSAG
ncbi:MAG: DUF937 domain-containing protein [Actinobacteria bacterium]|nr:DUF937 domain-containing protein [Actinomycetota bacterium]MBA3567082.1 DUF937 domain-containing protein [Actinomycetota bacterium]